jgi:hypothetical protein
MMKRRFGPILLAVGIFCGTCAWAQNDTGSSDTATPTQPGPQPAYTYPDATPSLDFLSQSVENSSITLGIGAGFSFDSNAYSNTSTHQDFWLFRVTPSIEIQQFRPRLSWNVSYNGGYQSYTYLQQAGSANGYSNLFSQHARGGFVWQMARHWQIVGSDTFTHSANPFDSYLATPGTPTMNNPNPVTYYPLTQFTQNAAILTLTDQLTKVDTLTFTGTENLRQTSTYNLLTSVPFYNLISYGGRANFSHQFSPRLSLGAGYDYNSLVFGHGQQRTGTQSISMTIDYLIRPNMTVSGWVGPQYTSTTDNLGPILCQVISCKSTLWSTSFGATFGWRSLRNSVRAGYTRGVSDGGGIIATSQSNSFNAAYNRMLSTKMNLSLGGVFFRDVSTTVANRSYNNFSLTAGLSYKLAKSLSVSGQYAYTHFTQSNTFLIGNSNYSANIVGVSVNYTWKHPLGR